MIRKTDVTQWWCNILFPCNCCARIEDKTGSFGQNGTWTEQLNVYSYENSRLSQRKRHAEPHSLVQSQLYMLSFF